MAEPANDTPAPSVVDTMLDRPGAEVARFAGQAMLVTTYGTRL